MPASHRTLLDDTQQMAGKNNEPRCLLRARLDIAVACRVLSMPNRTGEKMHLGFAFTCDTRHIGERPCLRMKGFPHQSDAENVIGISCTFGVGGFPNGYLYLFECLKNRNVVVAAQKLRPDFLYEDRLQ